MRPDLRTDERGLSVTVNHVLAIGITTVLVAGLLLSAGALVEGQRETVTAGQLEVVGEQVRSQIASLVSLASEGGTVTARVDALDRVASGPYTISLVDTGCPPRVGAPHCLELTAAETSVYVGVANASGVSVSRTGNGGVRVTVRRSGTPTASPVVEALPRRVGVTEDVGEAFLPREVVNASNRLPIIDYMRFEPANPVVKQNVTLIANATDLDGEVRSYRWDVDGDGTYGYTGKQVLLSPLPIGVYPVTLQVVDEDGGSRTRTESLRVAGVTYNNDSEALDRDGDDVPGGLGFSVSNQHPTSVTITHVYVAPEGSAIGQLDAAGTATDEVVVRSDVDTSATALSNHAVYAGGRIVELSDPATIDASGDGTVYLTEFRRADGSALNMTNHDVTIGLRYRANGTTFTVSFRVSPDEEAGLTTLLYADFERDGWWNDLGDHGFEEVGTTAAGIDANDGSGGGAAAEINGYDGGSGGIVVRDSAAMNTTRYDYVNVSYWVKEGGSGFADASTEELHVEYLAANGTWVAAGTVNATGSPGTVTTDELTLTAASARHDNFKIRFWQEGGEDGLWYVDEVRVTGRETL